MASPFYVLKSRHADVQLGEEFRTSDEVTRVTRDGLIYTKRIHLARWCGLNGFEAIIDPHGELCEERGLLVSEVADVLGIPAGAAQAMIDAGQFDTYEHPAMIGVVVLRKEQVDAVAYRLDSERVKAVDETGDEESSQLSVADSGSSGEEE